MKLVETNGVRIAAESFGAPAKEAIVLAMGATASMLGWPDELCTELAGRGHFVIRYDNRDTGLSIAYPAGEPSYAAEDMADDLLGVIDAHAVECAHLVGMSLGGFIGQMAALTWPDRIASLTLIGSEPLGWDGEPLPHIAPAFIEHFEKTTTLDWSDKAAVGEFLLEIERLCAGSAHPFDEARARNRIGRDLERARNIASAFNHGMLGTRDDWTGRFRGISQPVLVIHGEEDPILPIGNGQALASGITNARLAPLPGIGHELPEPVIPLFVETISAFVRGT